MRNRHWTMVLIMLAMLVPATTYGQTNEGSFACSFRGNAAERPSPGDSAVITLDGRDIQVCYSRPSARGRTMIGGEAHPFGSLWRAGANEPTTINLPFAAEIAGVRVEAGAYSLYTRLGASSWDIHVNRSLERWGVPISDEVSAQDVGHGTVPVESLPEHVETFTLQFEETGSARVDLIIDWERTRVRVPIVRVGI